MSVDMGFFGNVAEGSAVTLEIVADAFAFKEHLANVWLEETGDNFDGGGLTGAVWAHVADDLACADTEADIVDCGETAIAFGQAFDFKHGESSHPLCSIRNRD